MEYHHHCHQYYYGGWQASLSPCIRASDIELWTIGVRLKCSVAFFFSFCFFFACLLGRDVVCVIVVLLISILPVINTNINTHSLISFSFPLLCPYVIVCVCMSLWPLFTALHFRLNFTLWHFIFSALCIVTLILF